MRKCFFRKKSQCVTLLVLVDVIGCFIGEKHQSSEWHLSKKDSRKCHDSGLKYHVSLIKCCSPGLSLLILIICDVVPPIVHGLVLVCPSGRNSQAQRQGLACPSWRTLMPIERNFWVPQAGFRGMTVWLFSGRSDTWRDSSETKCHCYRIEI